MTALRKRKVASPIARLRIRMLYLGSSLTLTQIAECFNVSVATACRHTTRQGLDRSGPTDRNYRILLDVTSRDYPAKWALTADDLFIEIHAAARWLQLKLPQIELQCAQRLSKCSSHASQGDAQPREQPGSSNASLSCSRSNGSSQAIQGDPVIAASKSLSARSSVDVEISSYLHAEGVLS